MNREETIIQKIGYGLLGLFAAIGTVIIMIIDKEDDDKGYNRTP